MSEPFGAIGFTVQDRASYEALAEEAYQRGEISKARRGQGVLHGCCWSLGSGLEVWTVLYESPDGLFYVDCRPAFRGHHIFTFYPWEIIEYEQDGEAVARGVTIDGGFEVTFELQNLTEINPHEFKDRAITAAVSGLAYKARIASKSGKPAFQPLREKSARKNVSDSDYLVRGEIKSWRQIQNQHTSSDLIWVVVDAGEVRLEVLVNRSDLEGELRKGACLSSEVWLQGHILNDQALTARYEGIDRRIPAGSFWKRLTRHN
ncbi:MAG: DUF3881 family protein [Acidobacteriota bacterium]|nr:MAG: DUF3881 family protein [Acidobacteriota bacterium]